LAGGALTVPTTGTYRIDYDFIIDYNGNRTFEAIVRLNGGGGILGSHIIQEQASSAHILLQSKFFYVNLAAGNTIDIAVDASAGGSAIESTVPTLIATPPLTVASIMAQQIN
jgi:hypothetical protein